jgi:hypothetical protein
LQMSYRDWRTGLSGQLMRRQIADLDAWRSKSRHLPALCLSPARSRRNISAMASEYQSVVQRPSLLRIASMNAKTPPTCTAASAPRRSPSISSAPRPGSTSTPKTIPGHRYQIEAWGKHVRSQSPVELSLGVDLTGAEDWQAPSVTWHAWGETGEDIWVHTQFTVRASGESMTLFLKGYHPFAVQGGATLFDDVRVVDLGP